MINKKFDIQSTRDLTGWAYTEMKWPSESEAKEATRKRNTLLQSISGKVTSHYNGNKISTGLLSPGCTTCGQGTWSCLFVGSLCTAHCFYCPQDRKDKKDRPPMESGILFDNPDDYVGYLEKFKFRGVGFSGGEPLLKFKEILSYIKKIKERLGKGIYVWVYTNGDLADEKKLSALKEAGLNEMRFDIAARKYDLKGVARATAIIDKVTVEIPAIPEDYDIVKRCLPRMEALGVAHLNLHQLHASQYCYKQFAARGYTFLHQPEIAILESEMTALSLVKYALDHNIGLPINYCSLIYKHRLQKKGYRKRYQAFTQEGHEGATESGFIRRLSIQDTPVNLKKMVKVFRGKDCRDSLWSFNKNGSELFVHHSLLKYIDFNKQGLFLTYFMPQLSPERDEDFEKSKEIALNGNRKVFVGKKLVYRLKLKDPATINSFRKLFIEKKNTREVIKKFYQNYTLKTKAGITDMMGEKERLDYLKTWEFIGSGLYEIY